MPCAVRVEGWVDAVWPWVAKSGEARQDVVVLDLVACLMVGVHILKRAVVRGVVVAAIVPCSLSPGLTDDVERIAFRRWHSVKLFCDDLLQLREARRHVRRRLRQLLVL